MIVERRGMTHVVAYAMVAVVTASLNSGCEREAPTSEDVLVEKLEGLSQSEAYAEMLSPLGMEVGFTYRVEKALAACPSSVPPLQSGQPGGWELACSWRFAEIYGNSWAYRMKGVYGTASAEAYPKFFEICSPCMSVGQILTMMESLAGREELGMAWRVFIGALAKHRKMERRENLQRLVRRAVPSGGLGPAPSDLRALDEISEKRVCALIAREPAYWVEKTMVAWMLKVCVGEQFGDTVWQCALEVSVPEYRRLLRRMGDAEISFGDQFEIVNEREAIGREAEDEVLSVLASPSFADQLSDVELRGLQRWRDIGSDSYEVPGQNSSSMPTRHYRDRGRTRQPE